MSIKIRKKHEPCPHKYFYLIITNSLPILSDTPEGNDSINVAS